MSICLSCADDVPYSVFTSLAFWRDPSLGESVDMHVNSQKSVVEYVNLFILRKQCALDLVLMVSVWPPHIKVVT